MRHHVSCWDVMAGMCCMVRYQERSCRTCGQGDQHLNRRQYLRILNRRAYRQAH